MCFLIESRLTQHSLSVQITYISMLYNISFLYTETVDQTFKKKKSLCDIPTLSLLFLFFSVGVSCCLSVCQCICLSVCLSACLCVV